MACHAPTMDKVGTSCSRVILCEHTQARPDDDPDSWDRSCQPITMLRPKDAPCRANRQLLPISRGQSSCCASTALKLPENAADDKTPTTCFPRSESPTQAKPRRCSTQHQPLNRLRAKLLLTTSSLQAHNLAQCKEHEEKQLKASGGPAIHHGHPWTAL